MCPTNDGFGNTEHYLSIFQSYDRQRQDLLTGASAALRPFIDMNGLSNNDLVLLLSHGDIKLTNDAKKCLIQLTLDFIHKTGRFA